MPSAPRMAVGKTAEKEAFPHESIFIKLDSYRTRQVRLVHVQVHPDGAVPRCDLLHQLHPRRVARPGVGEDGLWVKEGLAARGQAVVHDVLHGVEVAVDVAEVDKVVALDGHGTEQLRQGHAQVLELPVEENAESGYGSCVLRSMNELAHLRVVWPKAEVQDVGHVGSHHVGDAVR